MAQPERQADEAAETAPTAAKEIGPDCTSVYVAMQENAEFVGDNKLVEVLGKLAFYSSYEDGIVRDSPGDFPTEWMNDNPRITLHRQDGQTGSPKDIRKLLTAPEDLEIVTDALRIVEALAQPEAEGEINITPPELQGPRTRDELPPKDENVQKRIGRILHMFGSSDGIANEIKYANVTEETYYPTRIPGYTVVARVVKTDGQKTVDLPTGPTTVRGNSVVLSLKRAKPQQDTQPQTKPTAA